MQLPSIDIPRPRFWDFVALLFLLVAAAVVIGNWVAARSTAPGTSLSGGLTFGIVMAQLAVCLGSLLVLGKTAQDGTIWGNLIAVGAMFAGMSGVLLAATLWTAA